MWVQCLCLSSGVNGWVIHSLSPMIHEGLLDFSMRAITRFWLLALTFQRHISSLHVHYVYACLLHILIHNEEKSYGEM